MCIRDRRQLERIPHVLGHVARKEEADDGQRIGHAVSVFDGKDPVSYTHLFERGEKERETIDAVRTQLEQLREQGGADLGTLRLELSGVKDEDCLLYTSIRQVLGI